MVQINPLGLDFCVPTEGYFSIFGLRVSLTPRLNVLTLYWLHFRQKLKQTFNVHVMFLGGSKLRSFKRVISYRYVIYILHEQHNGI